jgi:hypothetical protein
LRTLATPLNPIDILYCMIDVSRLDNPTWRYQAVTKDLKNPYRIRITYRDKSKYEIIKCIAEIKLAPEAYILQDNLYPVRVDNISYIAVLDKRNKVRTEITETLGRENNTKVIKITWLTKRDIPKAYGLMVIYYIQPPFRQSYPFIK